MVGSSRFIRTVTVSMIVAILLLITGSALAQTAVVPGAGGGDGPGGVGVTDGTSTLELWLRADQGLFINFDCTGQPVATTVGCWQDQSGNGFHPTQTDTGLHPTYVTGAFNNQPVLYFNGDYLAKSYEAALNSATFSAYGVWRVTGGTGTFRGPVATRDAAGAITGWNLYASDANLWSLWVMDSTNQNVTGSAAVTLNQSYIVNGVYDGTNQVLYVDGTQNAIQAVGFAPNTTEPLYIGISEDGKTPSFPFIGDIAEVIIFSEAHNSVERILIENYLSAKYNIPVATDVYAGDGNGNGDFDLDVAGIGRFGGNQHTQAFAAGMVVVNNTFLQNDGDWLLFGHNTAVNGNTTDDLPTTGDWESALNPQRWTRHFYIDVTDANTNGGTVNIVFDLSDGAMGGVSPAIPAGNYRLLGRAGTVGQFSEIAAAATAVVGDQVQFTGVNVADLGSNFTLGTLDAGTSPTAVGLQAFTADAVGANVILLTISILLTGLTMLWLRRRSTSRIV